MSGSWLSCRGFTRAWYSWKLLLEVLKVKNNILHHCTSIIVHLASKLPVRAGALHVHVLINIDIWYSIFNCCRQRMKDTTYSERHDGSCLSISIVVVHEEVHQTDAGMPMNLGE